MTIKKGIIDLDSDSDSESEADAGSTQDEATAETSELHTTTAQKVDKDTSSVQLFDAPRVQQAYQGLTNNLGKRGNSDQVSTSSRSALLEDYQNSRGQI